MSTHCSRYPNCPCPKEIGYYCHLPQSAIDQANKNPEYHKRHIESLKQEELEKFWFEDTGIKKRNKKTHLMPKRKKRK